MLSPISNSTASDIGLPKPSLNSSKDSKTLPPTEAGNYIHTEDLYLKSKNRDGDVLEVRAKAKDEPAPSMKPKTEKPGDAETEETDPAKQAWKDVREWANRMQDELKAQQQELMKEIVKRQGKAVDSGDGKFLILYVSVSGQENETQNAETAPPVPEYWNAENTSDRIVRMATGFARVSGLDPREFAEKIKAAVEDGFSSAHAITGDLPGAAGKLNKDTHDLVNSKLQKWLDDWEAGAYNQSAQQKDI